MIKYSYIFISLLISLLIYSFNKTEKKQSLKLGIYYCKLLKVIDGDTIIANCNQSKQQTLVLNNQTNQNKQQILVLSNQTNQNKQQILVLNNQTNQNEKIIRQENPKESFKKIRVRFSNIDTPELGQNFWGVKAKNKLLQLINKNILISIIGTDIYGRSLGTIYNYDENNTKTNLGLELVKLGFARVYSRYKPPKEYIKAMKQAKKLKLGIWAKKGLQQDPQKYRRLVF